jgi:hypothetical protein
MNKYLAMAATAGATGVMAASAGPASAYTVTGGPNFTATTAAAIVLTDNNTGSAVTCTSSTATGAFTTGMDVGPTLGAVSAIGFSNCTGPLGITFTATANSLPYSITATGPTVGGVTPGEVPGVNVRISGPLCSATVTGAAPGRYNNATRRVNLLSGATLTISNVSGCLGLLNDGDTASVTTAYNMVGSPSNPIAINN